MLIDFCTADCEWGEKGLTVEEGEVVGFKSVPKKIRFCKNGKLIYKLEWLFEGNIKLVNMVNIFLLKQMSDCL